MIPYDSYMIPTKLKYFLKGGGLFFLLKVYCTVVYFLEPNSSI